MIMIAMITSVLRTIIMNLSLSLSVYVYIYIYVCLAQEALELRLIVHEDGQELVDARRRPGAPLLSVYIIDCFDHIIYAYRCLLCSIILITLL